MAHGSEYREAAQANLPERGDFNINIMLGRIFNVSEGYVKDARRKLREEHNAREDAERHSNRAAELEEAAKEAAIEMEAAKIEDDKDKMREIASELNRTTLSAVDAREKAAELSQQASVKASEIKKIHQKQANLRTAPKEQKTEPEDPVSQLRTRINSSVSNLKNSISSLAEISGQGVDEYNFIGRKISEMVSHFEDSFGMSKED
jgi:DNA repair exonuclease SbcCD ATPase subunit